MLNIRMLPPLHETRRRFGPFAVLLLSVALVSSCAQAAPPEADLEPVRPPAKAGSWYPGHPGALEQQIELMLRKAPAADLEGRIVALVSPHAGYDFSGPTAAAAYRQVRGRDYDAVVVLAPSHFEPFRGASVFARGSYRTPLDTIPVDTTLADAIISGGGEDIYAGEAGHRVSGERTEHSLEIQLPFLQRVVPDLKIVPIVVGQQPFGTCRRIASAIAKAVKGREVLIVASSDLYHGYNYGDCVKTDARTLGHIEKLDARGLDRGLDDGTCQACGGDPIIIAMLAAKQLGADRAHMIARTNSNDVTGQKEGYVVGYGAVAFLAPAEDAQGQGKDPGPFRIEDSVRSELLQIARSTLEHAARRQTPDELDLKHPDLEKDGAAFVTLTVDGQLRGCIGYLEAVKPLGVTVQRMAVAAALHDTRFRPVGPEEVEDIRIEISVLSPMVPCEDVNKIEVGRHGLVIEQGRARGVLLPQVPTDYGWGRDTYLKQICRKAGLPPDAWKASETRLWTFEAEVFGEHQAKTGNH